MSGSSPDRRVDSAAVYGLYASLGFPVIFYIYNLALGVHPFIGINSESSHRIMSVSVKLAIMLLDPILSLTML
jgi:hypothetical protein